MQVRQFLQTITFIFLILTFPLSALAQDCGGGTCNQTIASCGKGANVTNAPGCNIDPPAGETPDIETPPTGGPTGPSTPTTGGEGGSITGDGEPSKPTTPDGSGTPTTGGIGSGGTKKAARGPGGGGKVTTIGPGTGGPRGGEPPKTCPTQPPECEKNADCPAGKLCDVPNCKCVPDNRCVGQDCGPGSGKQCKNNQACNVNFVNGSWECKCPTGTGPQPKPTATVNPDPEEPDQSGEGEKLQGSDDFRARNFFDSSLRASPSDDFIALTAPSSSATITSSSTSTIASRTGVQSTTLQPVLPAGWYWVPDTELGELVAANDGDGTQMRRLLSFHADGGRTMYYEFDYGSDVYYPVSDWDHFDNFTETAWQDVTIQGKVYALVDYKRKGLIEERYNWAVSTSSVNLDIDTVIYASPQDQSGTVIPHYRRSYTFDASGSRILSVTAPETEYVASPNASGQFHDIGNKTTNRLKRVFTYQNVNFLGQNVLVLTSEHFERPGGWTQPKYSYTYTVNYYGQTPLLQVDTITDRFGTTRQISYQANSFGGATVISSDSHGTYEFKLDSCDRLREQKVTATYNPRSGDPRDVMPSSQAVSYEYAFDECEATQVSKITYANGLIAQFGYDPVSGLLTSSSLPSPTGSGTVTKTYTRDWFFNGNTVLSERDELGVVVVGEPTYIDRLNSWDPGGKIASLTSGIRGVSTVTGTEQDILETTYYEPDGRVRLSTKGDNFGVQFFYEGEGYPSPTKRKLLMGIATGPVVGGVVDLSDSSTTFGSLERNSSDPYESRLGYVTAMIEGLPGSEKRTEYEYDRSGRVARTFFARGGGDPGTEMLIDYDVQGYPAVVRHLNKDHNNSAPADSQGNNLGAEYLRNEIVRGVGGRVLAKHMARDALFAPSVSAPTVDSHNSTYHYYDPITGLENKVVTAMSSNEISYDLFGNPYTMEVVVGGQRLTHTKYYYNESGVKSVAKVSRENASGSLDEVVFQFQRHHGGKGIAYRMEGPDGVVTESRFDRRGDLIANRYYTNAGSTLMMETSVERDIAGRATNLFIRSGLASQPTQMASVLYTPFSEVRKAWDQFGNETDYRYDAANRLVQVSKGSLELAVDYYPNSDLVQRTRRRVSPSREYWTSYAYNTAFELVREEFLGLDGASTARPRTYEYNSHGVVEAGVDIDPWEKSYGADGFVWWANRGSSSTPIHQAQRTFNTSTRQTSISNISPAGQWTTAVYGALGELRSVQYPGRSIQYVGYDLAYNPRTSTDSSGTIFSRTRDSLGRTQKLTITPQSGSGATPIELEVMARASLGQVQSLEQRGAAGTVRHDMRFNALGGFEGEDLTMSGVSGVRSTTLDRVEPNSGAFDYRGYIHGVTVDGVAQSFSHNVDGLITSVDVTGQPAGVPGNVLQLDYDGASPTEIRLANGMKTVVQYSVYGQLESVVTLDANDNPVDGFELGYDQHGRVRHQKRADFEGFGSAYKYDQEGRLSEWKRGVNSLSEFDNDFNSIQSAMPGSLTFHGRSLLRDVLSETGAPKTYNPDMASERPTSVNGAVLGYDNNGALTQDNVNSLERVFDALGRVIEVRSNGQTIESYEYDAMSRRVIVRDSSGNAKIRRYSGWVQVTEEDSAGLSKLNFYYPYVPDETVAYYSRENGNFTGYYPSHQFLGASALFSDDGVTELEKYAYSRDGKPTVRKTSNGQMSSSSYYGNDRLFHYMQQHPATGDYHVRKRDYNPELGKFVSADPVETQEPDHSAFGENPILNRDPMGDQHWADRQMAETFAPFVEVWMDLFAGVEIETNPRANTIEIKSANVLHPLPIAPRIHLDRNGVSGVSNDTITAVTGAVTAGNASMRRGDYTRATFSYIYAWMIISPGRPGPARTGRRFCARTATRGAPMLRFGATEDLIRVPIRMRVRNPRPTLTLEPVGSGSRAGSRVGSTVGGGGKGSSGPSSSGTNSLTPDVPSASMDDVVDIEVLDLMGGTHSQLPNGFNFDINHNPALGPGLRGDVFDMPFRSNSIPEIVVTNPHPDIVNIGGQTKWMDEAFRVLRPKGKLIFNTAKANPSDRRRVYMQRWLREQIELGRIERVESCGELLPEYRDLRMFRSGDPGSGIEGRPFTPQEAERVRTWFFRKVR